MKRILGLLLALLVLTPLAPAHGAAAPAVGPAPGVVWMRGLTIHTPGAPDQTLPLPASHAESVRLLGKRHGSWIVVDTYSATAKVLSVKGHRVRTVWKHVVYDPGTVWALDRTGDEVVQWFTDRGDRTAAAVFDLRGHHVASRTFGAGEILDFVDGTLLLGFQRTTVSWTPGTAPVQVAGAASLADAERDVLFTYDDDYATGPTTLSAPGTPAWHGRFDPRLISPDDTWVVGTGGRSGRRLVVRSLADGSTAAVSGLSIAADAAIAWEPDGSLLAEVHTEDGDALERCTTAGDCALATDSARGPISFLDQGQFFENY